MAQEFERRGREGRDCRMVSSRETCVWFWSKSAGIPNASLVSEMMWKRWQKRRGKIQLTTRAARAATCRLARPLDMLHE